MTGRRQYIDIAPPRYSLWKAFRQSFKSLTSAPLIFGCLCILGYIASLVFVYFDAFLFGNTPAFLAYPVNIIMAAAIYAVGAHILIQLFSMQHPQINRIHLDFTLFKRLFILAVLFAAVYAVLIESMYQLYYVTMEGRAPDNTPVKMVLTLRLYEFTVLLCLSAGYLVSFTFLSLEKTKSIKKTLLFTDGLLGRAIAGHLVCFIAAALVYFPLIFLDVSLQINNTDVHTYYTDTNQLGNFMPAYESSFPVKIISMFTIAISLLMTVGICASLARQKITYLKATAAKKAASSS